MPADFAPVTYIAGDRWNLTAVNSLESRIDAAIAAAAADIATADSDIADLQTQINNLDLAGSNTYINAKTDGGILTDGSDQTSAWASFFSGVPAGSTVFLPPGTYTGLIVPGKQIHLLGAGWGSTEIRPPATVAAGSKLVNFATDLRCSIRQIKLNGMSNANLTRGVNSEGSGTDKSLIVANCLFQDFRATTGTSPHGGGAAAIYVWTADATMIFDNDIIDCVFGVYMDAPGPDCRVVNNRVSSPAAIMRNGITFRRTTGADSGALCAYNTVSDARVDSGGVGVDGHGIDMVRVQGMRVIGNAITNTQTSSIHVGAGSYGAKVLANDQSNAGIGNGASTYVEMNIGATDPTGINPASGRRNGCIIKDNTIYNNTKWGVSLSYAAGSILQGNMVYENGFDGIFADSDLCILSQNLVFNSYKANAAAFPTSTPNVQAHIRVTTGDNCIVADNLTYDNQATPTTDYGIAVSNNGHIVHDNVGNGTVAEIYQASGGTNNLTHDNLGNNDSGGATNLRTLVLYHPGDATAATGVATMPMPYAGTIASVYASVGTAPTGSSIIFDLMKNGTTMFTGGTGRPTIAASAKFSTAVTPAVTSFAAGDSLRLDIVQDGSTITGGTPVTVWVEVIKS